MVFSRNLDYKRQVDSDIGSEHRLYALKRILNGEVSKVRDEPVGLEKIGMDNSALDIVEVGVVLESSLKKSSLLTKLGNVWSIVVRENLVAKNSISDLLRATHQVHFEKLSLEMSFGWSIVLESIKQEGSALLDESELGENIDDLRNISQGLIIGDEGLGELGTLIWVHAHDMSEKENVVWGKSNFLGVLDDLIELTSFSEAADNFVGCVGSKVNRKTKSCVGWFDEVSELFRALKLVFLEPFLDELLSTLSKNRSTEFESFNFVQLSGIKKNAEVLKKWGGLSGLRWNLLELLDYLVCSKNTARGLCSDFGGICKCTLLEKKLELFDEKIIGTTKVTSSSDFKS